MYREVVIMVIMNWLQNKLEISTLRVKVTLRVLFSSALIAETTMNKEVRANYEGMRVKSTKIFF